MKRKGILLAAVLSMLAVVCAPLKAQVSFFQPPQYAGSGSAVFVADFNSDGKPDLLSSDGAMNLGKGDGTFTPGTSVSGASLPVLAVTDFNGDGKPDLLEQGTGTLLVLLGNGDGTFQSAVSTSSGSTLTAVVAVDLNGDGCADVVGVFNSFLFVYINKGNGTFATGVSYSLGATSTSGTVLSLGDFNGDTKADISVSIAGDNVEGQEIVLLGNGDGTFQAAKASAGIYYPQYASAGDFNGDGKLDLAINSNCDGGCPSDAAYILLGNGDGTFQAPTVAFPGTGSLAAVDLNGDGKLDLIHYAAVVQIYLGNGDSTFSIASMYLPSLAAITSNFALAVADFNSDDKPDIAAGGGIFLGLGNGAFQGIQLGGVPDDPIAVATGDFDKNGTVDVVAISSDSLYVLSNNGGGQLTLTHNYSLQQPGIGVVTADLNGDGNLDFAVLGVNSTDQSWSYSVFLGNGDGSFQSPVTYPQSTMSGSVFGPDPIVVADFNSDHKVDLAVAVPEDESLAVLLGNGDGTFAAPVYYYVAGNTNLLVADFNGDGKLDIAVGSGAVSSGPQTAVLIGNGDGSFQPAEFPVSLQSFAAQFTADLNNDGKADLMSPVQVALGNGDGTFTQLPVMEVQTYSVVNAIGDLNVDGKVDALAADFGVLLGNGDGTFGNLINQPAPSTALIADMNGDRVPDVVFPFQALGMYAVGVLLNTTLVAPPPDFQMGGSGFSPTPVAAGNSATSTITVTPLNGFSGSVALSCAGVPTGVVCSFNPASIGGGTGTSTFTVSTDSSLAGGNYGVTVLGVSGSVSHNAGLTLTVESGTSPDFQVSATAASPTTVAAGGSATSTVTVAALNGFSSAVAITCDSGVSGVTCSLNPASVTPSGSTSGTSALTINTTAAVSPGSHPVTITGTSGGTVHSTGVTLTVQSDFTLAPASGSPTSQTISAGQTASFNLAIAPIGSFTGAVDLSCAITPAVTPAPTCTPSSSSVQINGGGSQAVTVKVATTAPTTGSAIYVDLSQTPAPLIWVLTLLGSTWIWARSRRRIGALSASVIVLASVFLAGCGGSGTPSGHTTPGTPSGTYVVTVTASSNGLSHNLPLQVIVQ
jgi:hypothetical protein